MADAFLTQVDDETVRALLARTALSDAPMILVGSSMHIERCSPSAELLTGLRPLERIDQLLSEQAVAALRDCIENKCARTLPEELDGAAYRLEIVAHRDGALLVYLLDDRAAYDGSLRLLQANSAKYMGNLLREIREMRDRKQAARLRKDYLCLQRMFNHSDELHSPPLPEQLRLKRVDLADLCRKAAGKVSRRTDRVITLDLPARYEMLVEPERILTAIYNLLVNAVQVSPPGEDINIGLHPDDKTPTITVSDRGPGMDAALFATLLDGWKRTLPYKEYLSIARTGAKPGFGLPLAQLAAQLHGGSLLVTARSNGGSVMHLVLSHLPAALAAHNANAPLPVESDYTIDELELSVL